MLNHAELNRLQAATRDFLVSVLFDDTREFDPKRLSEEHARRFAAAHGMDDQSSARLVYSLAVYLIEKHPLDLFALQGAMRAEAAGRPEGSLQ